MAEMKALRPLRV